MTQQQMIAALDAKHDRIKYRAWTSAQGDHVETGWIVSGDYTAMEYRVIPMYATAQPHQQEAFAAGGAESPSLLRVLVSPERIVERSAPAAALAARMIAHA